MWAFIKRRFIIAVLAVVTGTCSILPVVGCLEAVEHLKKVIYTND